jgi:hypothetical protein
MGDVKVKAFIYDLLRKLKGRLRELECMNEFNDSRSLSFDKQLQIESEMDRVHRLIFKLEEKGKFK